MGSASGKQQIRYNNKKESIISNNKNQQDDKDLSIQIMKISKQNSQDDIYCIGKKDSQFIENIELDKAQNEIFQIQTQKENINPINLEKTHSLFFNKNIHDQYQKSELFRKGSSNSKFDLVQSTQKVQNVYTNMFKMNTNESVDKATIENQDEDFHDLDINLNDYDTYKLMYDFYNFLQNKMQQLKQEIGKQDQKVILQYDNLQQQLNKILIEYKTNKNKQQILATSYLELLSCDSSEVFEEKQCRIQVREVKKAKLNESWEKEKNEDQGEEEEEQKEEDEELSQGNGYQIQSNIENELVRAVHKKGIGMACVKGEKTSQQQNQDDYLIYEDPVIQVLGVFDGQGICGEKVSSFCQRYIIKQLLCNPLTYIQPAKVLENIINSLDGKLLQYFSTFHQQNLEEYKFSSVKASIVIKIDKQLTIAHVGDTQVVLVQKNAANKLQLVQLTEDHLPSVKEEKTRICSRGGEVKRLSIDQNEKVYVRGRLFPGLNYT